MSGGGISCRCSIVQSDWGAVPPTDSVSSSFPLVGRRSRGQPSATFRSLIWAAPNHPEPDGRKLSGSLSRGELLLLRLGGATPRSITRRPLGVCGVCRMGGDRWRMVVVGALRVWVTVP